MKKHNWATAIFAALVGVALVGAALVGTGLLSDGAFAARRVCDDGSYPPCNKEGDAATNNLSRPTITFSGGGLTNVTCGGTGTWSDLVTPMGQPSTGWPIDTVAYYFVQGVNKWQAPCATWDLATAGLVPVTGAWGDNLTGDAKLKVGSPIRVELVLAYDSDETVDGYLVDKLQPALLDRESKYGTLATVGDSGDWEAIPTPFVPGVYDHQAQLSITNYAGFNYDQPASAEINAKGIVVYGYNLRVPTPGQYTITFTMPNVDFNGADAGDCGGIGTLDDHTCALVITVGGGGSGGKRGRP